MKTAKPPGRGAFARITLIHQFVSSQRYPSIRFFEERMEVSRRTIERDIESLRDFFGAPICYDHFKKGYYYEKPFKLPHVKLTEGEALALVFSQHLFSQFKITSFHNELKTAIEKLYEMLPETISLDLNSISEQISFDVKPPRGEEERLSAAYENLVQVISKKATVTIEYYTAYRDETSTRDVDPYHLRYHLGAWYLIAFCHTRNCVRVFAVDRIISCVDTGKVFSLPEEFSLENFLRYSFGIEIGSAPVDIAVRFDEYQARFMREMIIHPSQEIEELCDGGIIIRMRIGGLGEVKRWVLSFGRHAEVLEPESLREEIKQELEACMECYWRGGDSN